MGNKADLLEIGRERKVEAGKEARAKQRGVLSKNDNTPVSHNTQKAIAETLGWSTGSPFRPEILRRAIFNTPRTPVDRYTHMGMFI